MEKLPLLKEKYKALVNRGATESEIWSFILEVYAVGEWDRKISLAEAGIHSLGKEEAGKLDYNKEVVQWLSVSAAPSLSNEIRAFANYLTEKAKSKEKEPAPMNDKIPCPADCMRCSTYNGKFLNWSFPCDKGGHCHHDSCKAVHVDCAYSNCTNSKYKHRGFTQPPQVVESKEPERCDAVDSNNISLLCPNNKPCKLHELVCRCDGPYTCKRHDGEFAFCSNGDCLCHTPKLHEPRGEKIDWVESPHREFHGIAQHDNIVAINDNLIKIGKLLERHLNSK